MGRFSQELGFDRSITTDDRITNEIFSAFR